MTTETAQFPDGIGDHSVRPLAGWRRHASPLSLVAFGIVLTLAFAGLLGHEREWHADANGTQMSVHMPEIIRNGEFFEIRIEIESSSAIGELGVGVDQELWEDVTVNTLIPAATEETSRDGEFRFTFGELPGDTPFMLKVDAQVNPDILGGNEGQVTVYDGDEPVASLNVSMMVLP